MVVKKIPSTRYTCGKTLRKQRFGYVQFREDLCVGAQLLGWESDRMIGWRDIQTHVFVGQGKKFRFYF